MLRVMVRAKPLPGQPGVEPKVPIHGAPGRFIGVTPVEVELTSYYQRLLDFGELEQATPPKDPAATGKANPKTKEA
jgi:hypothetical protein